MPYLVYNSEQIFVRDIKPECFPVYYLEFEEVDEIEEVALLLNNSIRRWYEENITRLQNDQRKVTEKYFEFKHAYKNGEDIRKCIFIPTH